METHACHGNTKRTVIAPARVGGETFGAISQNPVNAVIPVCFLCVSLDLYANLLKRANSEVEMMIEKDLSRTFPEIEEFKLDVNSGKNRLYNVLKAYAHYDPEVGYCQGMNYVAAMLLRYIQSEEQAFLVFVSLMETGGWRELYQVSMARLHQLLDLLAKDLKRRLPNTFSHLAKLGLEFSGVFSHIFLTGFVYRTPMKLATRIFDLFIVEREKVLIGTAVNMLRMMERKVLAFDSMVRASGSCRTCTSTSRKVSRRTV